MTEIRRVPFAVSVDALMHQWARQDDGPAGSAMVVTTEIAGRLRGGVEWRHADSISVAVLARPRALEPAEAELGWLATSLGVVAALDRVASDPYACEWPDRVVTAGPTTAPAPTLAISSVSQLGPGRIDHVLMIARCADVAVIGSPLDTFVDAVVGELRAAALLLDEPDTLVAQYTERCSTLGRRVSMTLLPHGSTRGLADHIGSDGSLVLRSPTGLDEPVSVGRVGVVETLD